MEPTSAPSFVRSTDALAIVHGIFFGKPPKTLAHHLHEPAIGMLLAPALLAGLCVLHGAIPRWLDSVLMQRALGAGTAEPPTRPVPG